MRVSGKGEDEQPLIQEEAGRQEERSTDQLLSGLEKGKKTRSFEAPKKRKNRMKTVKRQEKEKKKLLLAEGGSRQKRAETKQMFFS